MDKISVIVPIYNVEDFLPYCLGSVINQTYQNLEIILINDGSTDSSPKICDEYALNDSRIEVIHQENGGLSNARNAGLAIATGDIISFVDSDDFLSLDFYKILLQTLIENNADVVECGFCKFKSDPKVEMTLQSSEKNKELFEAVNALELLMKEYFKQIVWNKIYRKEVVAGLLFPTNKINEDEFWTYKVFGNAKRIIKISDILYFYRQQENSIMGKEYSIKRLDGLQALEERIFYMREYFPKLENLAIQVFCFACIAHYQKICENEEIDTQKIIRKEIKLKVNKFCRFNIYRNWGWKAVFWLYLFILSPKLSMKFRSFNEYRIQKRKS